ncbi:myristoyl-CoA:protein N-myristoyltransferase [Thamnocephalis sphaerospora]|uniref:Glycylpeptide N-tetradecanoyltransferase n=1 Tax=Thamnocephalis sphaerospora TaxID=78915 RepID=A0A4P9XR94_9FUNG|nr:myristoyl-CoA:protein N-myristoyltransferase [Thamnocephalis sphaerospora]|eukprot:RKP08604.1 myristoyl-CoA:protein N-myristoyltransferase [Thamnocephalis sphaerospora]
MTDNQPSERQLEKQPAVESSSEQPKDTESADAALSASASTAPVLAANDPAVQQQLNELLNQLQLQAVGGKPPSKEHKFWDTQPHPPAKAHILGRIADEKVVAEGAIEPSREQTEIRAKPLPLPNGFEWCVVDVTKEEEMKELYRLLSENYVEDDDAMFRFDYSPEFLNWALKPPGWHKEWHLGVRVSSNRKLVAFIAGIPVHFRVRKHKQLMAEINFLCVLKKLRSKRLAPMLIKEVTRRIHLTGTFQAVYTAGAVLPRPVASCRYFHRSLNPKKLVETGFSQLPSGMTMKRLQMRFALPKETSLRGLRQMRASDAPKVRTLLNRYLERKEFAPIFSSAEEIVHWLLHRDGVVWSYVVETPDGKITDLVSFYAIPSTVINASKYKTINAAYQFYYASSMAFEPNGEALLGDRLRVLFKDALILARSERFDVWNCLDLMDNREIIDELRFGPGDGTLHYYLYNYKCHSVEADQVGLIML